MKQESVALQQAFEQFIAATEKGKRKKANGNPIQKSVIRNYRIIQKAIADFEAGTGTTYRIRFLDPGKLTHAHRENAYWKNFLDDYVHYGRVKRKWSDSYLLNNLKVIKAVFNYLQQIKGWTVGNFHKALRLPVWQAAPLVILPHRLQWLIQNKDFRRRLKPCLRKTLDITIIGCTLGLRYADLMALKPAHFECRPGGNYISICTSKTGYRVCIPLPDYALNILETYRRKNNKWLLPRLSNGQFNKQVKVLGKLAGWTEETPKYRSLCGRQAEVKSNQGKTWRFYQHLSAHTLRRTAITTLLLLGVNEAVVRTISGHAPGSREFFRYVAYVQGYLDKQVKEAHRLLLEQPGCYT